MTSLTNKDLFYNQNEEYEIQLFSFGRQKLKESLKSLVNESIQTKVQEANEFFSSSLKLDEATDAKIASKFNELSTYSLDKSKGPLNKIYSELDKLFKIPDNVLLPEDEYMRHPVSAEEYELLKSELDDLQTRALRAQALESILEQELKDMEALQPSMAMADKAAEALEMAKSPPDYKVLFDALDKLKQECDFENQSIDDMCT